MLKLVGAGADGPLVVLGLDGENLARLVAGEPVLVDVAEVLRSLPGGSDLAPAGRKLNVVIAYGKTHPDLIVNIGKVVPVREVKEEETGGSV